MPKAILTMGASTRLVEALIPGLGSKDLFFSLGEEIPDLKSYDNVSYWMGGAYALQLQKIGLAKTLCSPGANWLPSVPVELLSRKVEVGTINDLANTSKNFWVKPSEAKVQSFPAGLYNFNTLNHIFVSNKIDSSLSIQWTESILDINFEHRFFIAAGKVITGSPYKVNGIGWHKDIDFSESVNASHFAQHVINELGDNFPNFATLDVGLNTKTSKWLVIEANRAWSSGLYGSNPSAALDVIESSCSYNETLWQWKPDQHLLELSDSWNTLKVVPTEEESLEFFKYSR